jgi:hypothetical protein
MPSDQFVPVTVPLYYEGHAYRTGSRIRVRVSAPNGDQPIWSFSETEPAGTAEVEIGYGDGMPSRLALPLVPAGDVPDQLPPCPGLRGEPCRDYVPFENDTSVLDGYARPKAATPIYAPLVPAYEACATPNRTHASPLAYGSCSPPQKQSSHLTVGTPDSNGQAARSTGAVRWVVQPGNPSTTADEADVGLNLDLTDVRRSADLSDYTGELNARVTLQVTDRRSGADEPATVVPFEFSVPVPCAADPSADVGATCAAATSAEAVIPGAVMEGARAVWELGRIAVDDGGPDEDASTTGDNRLFEVQGVFVP